METYSVRQLVVIVIATLVLCTALLTYPASDSSTGMTEVVATHMRLIIPSINVDSAVESVGRTSAGAMDVPSGLDSVALFNQGVLPGQVGSAVIAGHWGWKDGRQAVFDNLHKLRKGDLVSVVDEEGKSTTFVVVAIRDYDETADATEVFTSTSGTHLNLVTCEGIWNPITKSYSQRLVVFTDLVS